ncbi:MAG: hypothetical protein Q9162_005230 [Coniocarpon cinnabarinum]
MTYGEEEMALLNTASDALAHIDYTDEQISSSPEDTPMTDVDGRDDQISSWLEDSPKSSSSSHSSISDAASNEEQNLRPAAPWRRRQTSENFRAYIMAHAGASCLNDHILGKIIDHRLRAELKEPDPGNFRYTAFCLVEVGTEFRQVTFDTTWDLREQAQASEDALGEASRGTERDMKLMADHSEMFTTAEMAAGVDRHKDNIRTLERAQKELATVNQVLTVMYQVVTEREKKIARLAAM